MPPKKLEKLFVYVHYYICLGISVDDDLIENMMDGMTGSIIKKYLNFLPWNLFNVTNC